VAVAEAGQATAQLQQLGPSGSQAAAEAAATAVAETAVAEAASRSPSPPQQQQAAPPPPPPPTSYAGNAITVVYETGWSSAYLHYNVGEQRYSRAASTPTVAGAPGSCRLPTRCCRGPLSGSHQLLSIHRKGSC
jgi:hypothetical protein